MGLVTGKAVLITGASRGIGEATARHFAAAGARVALTARSADRIQAIADDITSGGGEAIAIPCDVADYAQMEEAVARTREAFGGLDVAILNAAVLDPIAHLDEADPAEWDRLIDINVKGVFHGIRACLPVMARPAGPGGTIITIGSGAAENALEGWSAYCASKAAVHHLNRCLHLEMAPRGIRALVLSPGTVATDMQRKIKASGINPVSRLRWEDHIPPEWPARALEWMCSPLADRWCGEVVALRDPDIRRRIGLVA